jgi:hypothetical protein
MIRHFPINIVYFSVDVDVDVDVVDWDRGGRAASPRRSVRAVFPHTAPLILDSLTGAKD